MRSEQSSVETRCSWEGGKRISVTIRDFAPLNVDELTNLGGDDSAPRPDEYLLAALQGSYATTTLLIADELGIPIDQLESTTQGVLAKRIPAEAGEPPGLRRLVHHVRVSSPATREQLNRLQKVVDESCPTLSLLRAAGVELETEWQTDSR